MNRLLFVVLLALLVTLGCAFFGVEREKGGHSDEPMGGAAGSSFGGAPGSGGAPSMGGSSFGGAPLELTLENLDVPARVELSANGELCWGFSDECEPIPAFSPRLIEWADDHRVVIRIPPGVCAIRSEINDEGDCWLGVPRIMRDEDLTTPYVGSFTRIKPACSETWRFDLLSVDDCRVGPGGGGS